MAGRDDRSRPAPGTEPAHNPFGALEKLRASLPSGPAAKAAPAPKGPARAVVRLERKGRGGKEVTVVSHLELKPRALDEWLKALKNALGCGGMVEADTIVLQGDQRKRIEQVLLARGVGKVTLG